jgi:hypothetical protein
MSLPPPGLRTCALAVILGVVLASPRAVQNLVTRADSGPPPGSFRPSPVASGTPLEQTPRCSVAVAYPDDLPPFRRVTLTNLVTDHDCPSELNTTVGLTFEVDNPGPARKLWWRRAESSFDVLDPTSGSIHAAGKNRVRLSDLVLDQTVTIEVLEGDQRLMSFTLRHF